MGWNVNNNNFVDLRFREIKGNQLPYGGVHLIRSGDLFQLKPVAESWIFKRHAEDNADPLWVQHVWMYELKTIVRQKDPLFAELLNRLREGKHTPEDLETLMDTARKPTHLTDPHLYFLNKLKDAHNDAVLHQHNGPKFTFIAEDAVVEGLRGTSAEINHKRQDKTGAEKTARHLWLAA